MFNNPQFLTINKSTPSSDKDHFKMFDFLHQTPKTMILNTSSHNVLKDKSIKDLDKIYQ